MHRYRIEGGPAQLGPHTVLSLTPAQFGPRSHNLEKLNEHDGQIICRALALIEFKAGEEIGLQFAPDKKFEDRFVAIEDEAPKAPPRAPEPEKKRSAAPSRPPKTSGGKPSAPTPAGLPGGKGKKGK